MSHSDPTQRINPWVHRLALLAVGCTFALLVIGGTVTTYKAGMAVEDWPSTFGHPWFTYPIMKWLRGPWDLFIEHGHRLAGQIVGCVAIALAIVAYRSETRRWARWLAMATLPAVIAQGVLGGLRVQYDSIGLARLHGCVGPLVFALFAAVAVVNSSWWRGVTPTLHPAANRARRLAIFTAVLAYLQLVLGAHIRHLPVGMSYTAFQVAVVFHLLVAATLLVHVGLVALRSVSLRRSNPAALRPALGLGVLMLAQLALGAMTWLLKYGCPAWLASLDWLAGPSGLANFVVTDGSPNQAFVTTTHAAVGWMILALSTVVALRTGRGLRAPASVLAAARESLPRAGAMRNRLAFGESFA